ncbi:hypothetical protein [Pseudoalteromonas denitrificans]|uniref:Aminomethyltransferase n=1 Tax=Pseudoalteromonas denitrificans DSM 6059 TaxID=1123010 RepID=A0A1I1URH0_9GAMM|nr:hypothetical protein [Pseudoalteromonas denitrificans]SFD71403.1 aminomethyltransferase [Pseudoalteromonas denitrificans DSM 6059]
MIINTTMFASHVLGSEPQIKNANNFTFHPQKQVLDIGGSAALPFLRNILDADVAKLTAPGMGLQTKLRPGNADFEVMLDVYYFSESAFRIIANTEHPELFNAWLIQHEEDFDIDIIKRSDLTVMLVSGDDAFDVLVEQFKFTPGIRLSCSQQRFGAQSGRVFVTAVYTKEHNGYELLASPTELANWQQEFTKLGFVNN